MPVVINEFEVVPASAPAPAENPQRSAETEAAKQKEKPSFAEILRRWQERAQRVRAH